MTVRRFLLATTCLFAAGSAAFAADIRVPQDFANLRDAIIAAQPGDHVIVTGGSFRNGRITKPDITLVGSGTRLLGTWEVTATGAVIEGMSFGDGEVLVTGDATTIRRCRFLANRVSRSKGRFRAEEVSGLVLEDCRATRAAIVVVRSPGAIVRRNRVLGSEIQMSGALALVEENVCTRGGIWLSNGTDAEVRRNRAAYLNISNGSDRALVEDNTVIGGSIDVFGSGVRVVRNRVVRGFEVLVAGNDVEIAGNRLEFSSGGRRYETIGVNVTGARTRVTDNVISNDGSSVGTDGQSMFVGGAGPATVSGNDIAHFRCRGIFVGAPASIVSENTVRGTSCRASIEVDASSCTVTDNVIEQSGSRAALGSGIVVTGDANALAGNKVTGARYDGISVEGATCTLSGDEVTDAGRCGITIGADAARVSLTDCVVTGARLAALCVLRDDALVVGGVFTDESGIGVLHPAPEIPGRRFNRSR